MSTPEENGQPQETSRSSFKLVRNAKGETQIEAKVYVGDSAEDILAARQRVELHYEALRSRYA